MRRGPAQLPIGLYLTQVSRTVSRAFDDALAQAGGSLPAWLVLLCMKTQNVASQRELARAVGVRDATLTHHLNAMEKSGLLTRRRDPANRRVHVIELTEQGESAFLRLRDTAVAFDARLRTGLGEAEIDALRDGLARLAANVATGSVGVAAGGSPPWAGLAGT